MPGGITAAAPVDLSTISRSVADWVLPVAEVKAWLASAQPGQRLLYAQGESLIRGETTSALRDAYAAGEVLLFQPRTAGRSGSFDYIAVKRVNETAKRMRGRTADPAMRLIFRAFRDAAEAGSRAPGNRALGELTGLEVSQVKWRVQKLVQERRIAVELVSILAEPNFRIVAILEKDGSVLARTAAPSTGGAR